MFRAELNDLSHRVVAEHERALKRLASAQREVRNAHASRVWAVRAEVEADRLMTLRGLLAAATDIAARL